MRRPQKQIQFTSYDELLGIEPKDGAGLEDRSDRIVETPLCDLHSFQNHPFRVLDDEKMQETVRSILKFGVLNPGIVRPRQDGGYEILSGHRRKRGCELAGKSTMPVIVRNYTDDEAVVVMVDANIQREDILPSEKAFAYRMKYEALRHQGSKGEQHTADAVGEAAGDSGRTVQRYIRLTELIKPLLDHVDSQKLAMVVGEKLSYLKEEEQHWLADAIADCGTFPTKAQAEQLKTESAAGILTMDYMFEVLGKKASDKVSLTIPAQKIRSYFPPNYTKEQIEEIIYSLLDRWKQNG